MEREMKTPQKTVRLNDLEVKVHSLSEAIGSPLAESVTIIDEYNDVSCEEAELIFDYLLSEGFISSHNANLRIVKKTL